MGWGISACRASRRTSVPIPSTCFKNESLSRLGPNPGEKRQRQMDSQSLMDNRLNQAVPGSLREPVSNSYIGKILGKTPDVAPAYTCKNMCTFTHMLHLYTCTHTYRLKNLFLKKSQVLLKKNKLTPSFLVQLINVLHLTMTLIAPRTLQGPWHRSPHGQPPRSDTHDCHLFYWWNLTLKNILYICVTITRQVKLQGWQPVQAPKPHSQNSGCSNLCTPSQHITGGRINPGEDL